MMMVTMKSFGSVYVLSDPKFRSCLWSFFIISSLIGGAYFIGSVFLENNFRIVPRFRMDNSWEDIQENKCMMVQRSEPEISHAGQDTLSNGCKNQCRPLGTEALPDGIVVKTSDLEMHPLFGPPPEKSKHSENLLAIAVGIKQKEVANQIIKKFLGDGFVVMLFHYDGLVDEWSDLGWSDSVIHVSAMNQTKWWFAKRFLHPDVVAEYSYIFLWDEDLGVENFSPKRYLDIVKSEGLEISQPALEPAKSEVHHQITVRRRRSRLHRRYYKLKGGGRCDDSSTSPPCVGWVEMMAPVLSRAAWRCVWYMIQNDLIHAWGLDMKLGYCAQGDRTMNVGVVDSEYLVHLGLPTLGSLKGVQVIAVACLLLMNKCLIQLPLFTPIILLVLLLERLKSVTLSHSKGRGLILNLNVTETYDNLQVKQLSDSNSLASSVSDKINNRLGVRKQSYIEMKMFKKRWKKAVEEDKCFVDPYQKPFGQTS